MKSKNAQPPRRLSEREGESNSITGTICPSPPASKSDRAADSKPTFDRQTFTTSRLLDYFSEQELVLQTGHDREHWPEVALKELVDNALDAAEDSGISPEIEVAVERDTLSVADNGPGIAPDVVARILDFSTKTSC